MLSKYSSHFVVILLGILGVTACSDEGKNQVGIGTKATAVEQSAQQITIQKWGPHGTIAGQGFLVQKNGDSALWIEFSGPGNANNLEIWFGDTKLASAIEPGRGGSGQIPPALLSEPKSVPIYILDKTSGKKTEVGIFEITLNK